MRKRRPKNLLLDREALRRGEAYCERHGTTLSRLVEDFLTALPGDGSWKPTSPIVLRIIDTANYGREGSYAYREHLFSGDRIRHAHPDEP